MASDAEKVEYHKGWKYYIDKGKTSVKKIALDASGEGDKWSINLWMYVGENMSSARATYNKMNVDKILSLRNDGFVITKNFHLSFMSSNLIFPDGKREIDEYLRYWKESWEKLRQVKREDFTNYFNKLEADDLISFNDRITIRNKIEEKAYSTINICPGFLIRHIWAKEKAIDIDNRGLFVEEFKRRVNQVFEALGDVTDI